jgi:signal transduction histidine kinase
MKSGKTISRRKKIIFYYLIAVVLPGIILGYMASRGIRNDQALREKENLGKLKTSSQTFFTEIDEDLERFMNDQTSLPVTSASRTYDPSLLILFVEDSTGLKNPLANRLLYLPEELLNEEQDRSTPSALLKEGQRLEFAEQKYSDAQRFYLERIQKTTDTEERKEALVASARLFNKMSQPEKALELYEMIRNNYFGSLLNSRIPLGLIASLEILKINKGTGHENEFKINLKNSLELLLHPGCDYDADQFAMFYRSFKEISNEPDDIIDSLFLELEAHRARTDYIIRVLDERDLIPTGGNFHYGNSKNSTHVVPINSGELQAMYLTSESNGGMKYGMVIDFPVYLKSVSEKLLSKIDPDFLINIKIEDINGNPVISRIVKEEKGYLSFPFPENLPNWKLILSENNPGFMTTLMKAGSGIYLVVFILIVLLMLLGFTFILYTLNVELRLNKLKSEFISNVSHELKSPLTSIRMMTEMLHHNRVDTDERKAEYYSAMLEESEHLSHLIDNILDFSRIDEDRKKYEFADLDLDKLTREFIKSISEMIRETGFEINYTSPDKIPVIGADRNAILQLLYNLVDNAIKFSGTSRKIDLELASKDNEIQLSVRDYGIGISAKDQEKIFERFYRSRESQHSGIRGSGIGLTIVKKIVEDHGGQLTVESRQGEGSTFMVRLPLS